jgi:hypothetical protein
MGFLDRLFGTNTDDEYCHTTEQVRQASAARSDDEIAVERYRYLLRTASPDAIEQVHEEAFSKLTPEQRKMLFAQLTEDAPPGDAPVSDDPRALAVSATRSEMRQPGTMERALGQAGNNGFGSMFASSLLGSVAGYVIASTLMSAFMPMDMGGDLANDGSADSGADTGSDFSGAETISADGGGFGDPGFGDAGFGDFGDFGF